MTDTMTKIASGLERAFAARGFAEPSVEDLRDAAGVSLRTLYKYTPSRADMVLAALEHRHTRYLGHLFDDLPDAPDAALDALFDRVGGWMASEAAHGCLFHGAVAAEPGSDRLWALLARHKAEVARRAAAAAGLQGFETELLIILDGLTQAWTLHRDAAVASAKRLGQGLRNNLAA
ncbi:Transcriptional regulator, TetR family [Roseivivax sp. THAF40]|uniref:TetR/AcrR family transcriptional regulator n=1 Tax=unclassified Roseivivax TaxID=2639302 RepID=UPI001268513F|nr:MULTISPECIES: TetR/AcrR family transcriptional regulator [unclassified Roseivivax]QFS81264.1 Transcriptional regulator, TetR family [Roseivivax sp. THAF197b]QFT44993.1 Transcriptional regulator, TetR family [Roseivivax sp. THAF40]